MQEQSHTPPEHQHSSRINNSMKEAPKRGRRGRKAGAKKEQVEEHESKKSRSRSRSNQRRRGNDLSQSVYEDEEHYSQNHQNDQSSDSENSQRFEFPSKAASIQTFADSIRQVFIDFFFESGYDKGFVFTPHDRIKLKKEEIRNMKKDNAYKAINWKDEHQWDPDRETEKVEKIFQNNTLDLTKQKNGELKVIFKQASAMFADQTTSQVYSLLFAILKIATIGNFQQQRQRLKQLTNEILGELQKWRFFGFNFSCYYKSKLSKEEQFKTHLLMAEQLLIIIKQKL